MTNEAGFFDLQSQMYTLDEPVVTSAERARKRHVAQANTWSLTLAVEEHDAAALCHARFEEFCRSVRVKSTELLEEAIEAIVYPSRLKMLQSTGELDLYHLTIPSGSKIVKIEKATIGIQIPEIVDKQEEGFATFHRQNSGRWKRTLCTVERSDRRAGRRVVGYSPRIDFTQ